MAIPLLIDTDMGIDDATALALSLASDKIDVRGVVGVGGNVPLDQVVLNIACLLGALAPRRLPPVGQGLEPANPSPFRRDLFGQDGLGESDLAGPANVQPADFRVVYRRAIEDAGGELNLLMLGPLTNLAAVLEESPTPRIRQVWISGGAVWTKGNISASAEFNFHRDPGAAAAVLSSGLPITVVPLDVTRLVCLDESHVARLAASGYRTGEVLSRLLEYSMRSDCEPGYGKAHIQDAVLFGALLWPDLFLRTRMRLDIVANGAEAGRCKPLLSGDSSSRVELLTAVNAVDLLENLLESLCHEAFIV